MPIAIAAKVSALLNGLTTDQLNQLSPVERRKFAELCFHWFKLADQPHRDEPKGRRSVGDEGRAWEQLIRRGTTAYLTYPAAHP
jgi:hypothetical protein